MALFTEGTFSYHNPHVPFHKNLQRRTWSIFQLWFSVGTDPKIGTVELELELELDGKKIKLEIGSVTVIWREN